MSAEDILTIELNSTDRLILNIALTALITDMGLDRIECIAVRKLQHRVSLGITKATNKPREVFFPPKRNMSFDV